MRTKTKIALALLLTVTSASSVLADNYAQGRTRVPRNQAPVSLTTPRMIESKPGLWTSSYDCVLDDGYGRYRSCSAN
jgi:hypothetical protein